MVVALCCSGVIFVGRVALSVHIFDSWIILIYKFNWKRERIKKRMEINKKNIFHFPFFPSQPSPLP
jgi:hypothetical protein